MSDLYSVANQTVKLLKENNLSVSFAESCTGGTLSQLITSVSGASQVFELGVCCYSNDIKHKVLNVPTNVLETYGAVSQETAVILAKEIRHLANSSLGVSVTGVAGPTKSEGKEVGTVYIGFCDGSNAFAVNLNAEKTLLRAEIRELSAKTALNLVIEHCLTK